jgi:hypothetical protein
MTARIAAASRLQMPTSKLRFRAGMPPICWGRPDSPQRELCAICHAKLPDVPLMLWDSKGACAAFCDACVDDWLLVDDTL